MDQPRPSPQAGSRRIHLSSPHLGSDELELVKEAFATNWIAPLGPHVDAFEREILPHVGRRFAAALSSGTAALHLALRLLGIKDRDEVFCSTQTFSATANPILYERANPVFIDSHPDTWTMDPDLLQEALEQSAARGKLPRAVIVVDLYGQCADYDRIIPLCAEFQVPVIEDAAEALGATYRTRKAGSFGNCAVISFNGNKIITTSGGGMLVSDDPDMIKRARFLATQARDPAPHYQHSVVGFNYRLSNVLAAIGRGQLRLLADHVAARRRNFAFYRDTIGALPGVRMMPQAAYGESNCWLTCITINPSEFGATREQVRMALEQVNIEARPIWKPLHLQPVFAGCRSVGGKVSEQIFADGLCLPSGSNLSEDDLFRVAQAVQAVSAQSR
jgi:pyridoxal phosphate-dependent aminotransferase EpsN